LEWAPAGEVQIFADDYTRSAFNVSTFVPQGTRAVLRTVEEQQAALSGSPRPCTIPSSAIWARRPGDSSTVGGPRVAWAESGSQSRARSCPRGLI